MQPLNSVILGRPAVVERLLLALLADGNVLMERPADSHRLE
jgi:hypothetical protein